MDIIKRLGDSLGEDGPHTAASVANTMTTIKPDELTRVLETVAINALGDPNPRPRPTGAENVSQVGSGLLHVLTGIGGVLVGSGLCDPNGPLAGLEHAYPIFGAVMAVVGSLTNWFLVNRSNTATDTALGK
jgi:hypothetical protein